MNLFSGDLYCEFAFKIIHLQIIVLIIKAHSKNDRYGKVGSLGSLDLHLLGILKNKITLNLIIGCMILKEIVLFLLTLLKSEHVQPYF